MAAHALARIAAAPAMRAPMPHALVTGVLPAEVADLAITHFPARDRLSALELARYHYPLRHIGPLEAALFCDLPAAAGRAWAGIAATMARKDFLRALVGLFPEAKARVGKGGEVVVELRLVEDLPGYALGPHTDSLDKLVTALLYLPPPGAARELGTSFYRPRDPGLVADPHRHYDFETFERLGSVPYQPNTMLVFPRTDTSFHGVEPTPPGSPPRRMIILNAYLR